MATKKTTRTARTAKTSTVKKAGPRASSKAIKQEVTEDDIRRRAEEIYLERIARGEDRPAEEDWLQAEKELLG
jgi:hypothetical protein